MTDNDDVSNDDTTTNGWSIGDRIDELAMHFDALQTDLDDNHPDGGPNFAYALGDLRAMQEQVDALIEDVSLTIRILHDHQKPNCRSDGEEIKVPKDVSTVRELNSAVNVKAGSQLMRVTDPSDPGAVKSLGAPGDPIVISDGDEFTFVEKPQEVGP